MARPYFSARHLESMALLPDTLEIGRAYFVDDEQVIVIDHGRGPVIYGKSPGPQGIAGEPIPQLQDQIDKVAEAVLTTNRTIWDINERELSETQKKNAAISTLYSYVDNSIHELSEALRGIISENLQHSDALTMEQSEALRGIISENLQHSDALTLEHSDFVKGLTEHNAEAISSIIDTMRTQFAKYDAALNILAKSISELYPAHFAAEISPNDPLDNETLSTDSGSWTIQQTTLKDGTIVLNLEAQELVIDNIKTGDSVDFDGSTWTVENVQTTDGTTTITIKP